nr:PREDICTED: ras association domain-containing protein 1 [Struthio camelus australis]
MPGHVLKLVRPVSVPATKRPPSVHDARRGQRAQAAKRRTSFYLPKDTVKHLHVLSHTRATEVIDALLKKFTVVDNPRKFALFERSEKDEQGTGRVGGPRGPRIPFPDAK